MKATTEQIENMIVKHMEESAFNLSYFSEKHGLDGRLVARVLTTMQRAGVVARIDVLRYEIVRHFAVN
jgi:DNA-binding IclR family transcriptional regulator